MSFWFRGAGAFAGEWSGEVMVTVGKSWKVR